MRAEHVAALRGQDRVLGLGDVVVRDLALVIRRGLRFAARARRVVGASIDARIDVRSAATAGLRLRAHAGGHRVLRRPCSGARSGKREGHGEGKSDAKAHVFQDYAGARRSIPFPPMTCYEMVMRAFGLVMLGLFVAGCDTGSQAPAAKKEPAPAPATTSDAALKLGAPIDSSTQSVALSDVAKTPSAFTDKELVTTGTVTSVCQHMGCWMEIKDDSSEAHIKMAGHKFFVPKTASGRKARVMAKLVSTPDDSCAGDGTEKGKGCNAEAEKSSSATRSRSSSSKPTASSSSNAGPAYAYFAANVAIAASA